MKIVALKGEDVEGSIAELFMCSKDVELKKLKHGDYICHVMEVSDEANNGTLIYVPDIEPTELFPNV